MERKHDVVAGTVTFSFDDGLEPVVFHAERASAANRAYAPLFGFGSRIQDGAALSKKQKDGTVIKITESMRRDEIIRLVDHFESGSTDWNAGRTPSVDPRATALAAKRGITYAEALAVLRKIEQEALEAAMA